MVIGLMIVVGLFLWGIGQGIHNGTIEKTSEADSMAGATFWSGCGAVLIVAFLVGAFFVLAFLASVTRGM